MKQTGKKGEGDLHMYLHTQLQVQYIQKPSKRLCSTKRQALRKGLVAPISRPALLIVVLWVFL